MSKVFVRHAHFGPAIKCPLSFTLPVTQAYFPYYIPMTTTFVLLPVDEDELKAAFEFFDIHKKGVLTPADLKQRYDCRAIHPSA